MVAPLPRPHPLPRPSLSEDSSSTQPFSASPLQRSRAAAKPIPRGLAAPEIAGLPYVVSGLVAAGGRSFVFNLTDTYAMLTALYRCAASGIGVRDPRARLRPRRRLTDSPSSR